MFHSINKFKRVSMLSLSTLPNYILDRGEITFHYQSIEQRNADCELYKKPPSCALINLHSFCALPIIETTEADEFSFNGKKKTTNPALPTKNDVPGASLEGRKPAELEKGDLLF